MTKRFAEREPDPTFFVILRAAKDLSKFIDAFEHCQIQRSEPGLALSARLGPTRAALGMNATGSQWPERITISRMNL